MVSGGLSVVSLLHCRGALREACTLNPKPNLDAGLACIQGNSKTVCAFIMKPKIK